MYEVSSCAGIMCGDRETKKVSIGVGGATTLMIVYIILYKEIRFPNWRCGPDMPFGMSDSIQSVVINGMVYVGRMDQ